MKKLQLYFLNGRKQFLKYRINSINEFVYRGKYPDITLLKIIFNYHLDFDGLSYYEFWQPN